MADDESGEEQPEPGEDEFELTPEQVESLRRTMDQVRRSLAPSIKLSESTLRNFAAVSRITDLGERVEKVIAARHEPDRFIHKASWE